MDPVFPGEGVDEGLVLVKGSVGFSGDDELVVFRQVPERFQQDVQPLIIPDQAEEQDRLQRRVDAERTGGRFPRKLFPEMGRIVFSAGSMPSEPAAASRGSFSPKWE